MKYLKKFESFSHFIDDETIQSMPYYNQILGLVENDPEIKSDFDNLVSRMDGTDLKKIEPLFTDTESAIQMLAKEITTFRLESMEQIDTQKMAREALKYLAIIGLISMAVKLFYKVSDYVFSNLDEMGIPAVAGGVLLILLFLAFSKSKSKKAEKGNFTE